MYTNSNKNTRLLNTLYLGRKKLPDKLLTAKNLLSLTKILFVKRF